MVVLSVLVGAATHLLWDSFTHPGWVADHLGVLRVQLGPLLVEKWLQHVSSVAGLVIVTVWAARRLRATTPDSGRPTRLSRGTRAAAGATVVAAGIAAGLIVWIHGILAGVAPFDPGLVFLVARFGIGVAGAALVLVVILWLIVGRARRARTAS